MEVRRLPSFASRVRTFIPVFFVCVKSENYESGADMMSRSAADLSIFRVFMQKPP